MPKAGLPEAALGKILGEHGAGKQSRIGRSQMRIVDVPPGLERQVVDRLSRNPHIKFAELDQAVVPGYVPNDPLLSSQWHLPKVGALEAWDHAAGAGVTIAILDSGVDAAHPDLVGRVVPGWNFYSNNSDTTDVFGHGTMVAGTAAASMSNGAGGAGLAGQSKIMPIRITDTSGMGYFSAAASGLTFAADKGAKVANMSFSGMQRSSAVIQAAQYFRSKGGVVTVSAGNTGTEVLDILPSDSMIAVSATDGSDNKTGWSSWGAYVDVSAPGASIYTTTNGGGYAAVNGTSFAAPLTAGVLALIMSAKPGLTSTQVESILVNTTADLGAAGKDKLYGAGRVNAHAALLATIDGTTTAPVLDTQAPTVAISNPVGSSSVAGLTGVDVGANDNVGVVKVELFVNGALHATDTGAPFGFSWDTTREANGTSNLVAVAYDAAGNRAQSASVAVNVANTTAPVVVAPSDTSPPVVTFASPSDGAKVGGNLTVNVKASDNSGTAALVHKLYIDGKFVASATGAQLKYNWNTKKLAPGSHSIRVDVADAAGNLGSASLQVSK